MNREAILEMARLEQVEAAALDKLGQKLEIGNYIVYGHALGRSAALKLGKILAIKITYEDAMKTITEKGEDGEWLRIKYKRPVFRIRVLGLDEGWNPEDASKWTTSKGTLSFPERIIRLDPNMLSPLVKNKLDVVEVSKA